MPWRLACRRLNRCRGAVEEGGVAVGVLSREWHGASQQLTLASPHGDLRWTPGGAQPINAQLRLGWQPQHEHFFDLDTGLRC
ncbi:MAG: hypothetical protein ACO3ZD_10020 [Cyanobium sp.]